MWRSTKNVNIKNQTYPPFQYYMMRELKNDISLVSPAIVDDTILNVSPGHGFLTGDWLVIWDCNRYEQAIIKNVAGDLITLDNPIASNFSVQSTVIRGNINFNVDGSITPVNFVLKLYGCIIPIYINEVVITMQSGISVPDDGKFGGIPALTNGLFFRQTNGINTNLGSYKSNQDFLDRSANVIYTSSAPAGTNGTQIKFSVLNSFGQVLYLDPIKNDYILGRVRDDLTGLNKMTVSLIGSFTDGCRT